MSFHHYVNPQADLPKLRAENVKLHPSTGIRVLVVGAGVGGLMAALESKRKGHDVRVVERSPSLSTAGKVNPLIYFMVAESYVLMKFTKATFSPSA